MGLLKHVILPVLALLNSVCGILLLMTSKESANDDVKEVWKPNEPIEDFAMHLMHGLGGAFLALAVNDMAAVLYGNGFHRATALFAQGIFVVVDGWSYAVLQREVPSILYGVFAVVVVGLLVHSQEPGVFTKDKGDKAKSG